MFSDLIQKKIYRHTLNLVEYYEVVEYIMKNGVDNDVRKFFITLNTFGMSKKEVNFLALALRDSGRVIDYGDDIFEKHSTGGIGDSTSLVIIPLLASLGYKVIKTTAKSFLFTNGTADRFGAIPNFSCALTDDKIKKSIDKTNACVLSNESNMCPADKMLNKIRIECGIESDPNLFAASIASKKMSSGADVVLVDVKFGEASIIPSYRKAIKLAKVLKYIFKQNKIKSIIEITNTNQMIGDAVGNAVEVVDAINVLQGKKNFLRKVACKYAVDMITTYNPKIDRDYAYDLVLFSLDNGSAYNKFLEIVENQGGDAEAVKKSLIFRPKKSVNFKAAKSGYVMNVNSLLMGELVRRLCKETHDNNIGIVTHVKVGDYVKAGDVMLSFYYNDDNELIKYQNAIENSIRLTSHPIKKVKILKKVIR